MNPPEMTLADAESILAQILEHPNLTLSYSNHVIAREALRKLAEAARKSQSSVVSGPEPLPTCAAMNHGLRTTDH